MMGGAISSYGCEEKYGEEGTTMAPGGDWNETMTTGVPGSGENDALTECKVNVAIAVTFVGGLIQVRVAEGLSETRRVCFKEEIMFAEN